MSLLRFLAGVLIIVLLSSPAGADSWTRPAVMAGTWYLGRADQLAGSVDSFLAAAKRRVLAGRTIGLVVPHAGHVYSGKVAGAAWAVAAELDPSPETVILLGPSHRYPLARPSIWPQGAYACPLGQVRIDSQTAGRLKQRLGAGFVRQAHLKEHCLEVQLPFVLKSLPKASLVPLLTGPPDLAEARGLGRALAEEAQGRSILLVASTDLSHFHSREAARRLDQRVAERIEKLDPEGLMSDASQGQAEACGLQALLAVMFAARQLGANQGLILDRADSARVSGDKTNVVGYLAAALVAASNPKQGQSGLDQGQRQTLRRLARSSVEAAVLGRNPPLAPSDDPVLNQPRGSLSPSGPGAS